MKRTYRFDKPLLERLREHHNLNTPQTHTMQEAADEIERLNDMIEWAYMEGFVSGRDTTEKTNGKSKT